MKDERNRKTDDPEKNCRTCISNDSGICSRIGIRIDDNNTCHRWKDVNWKEELMKIFLRRR